MKLRIFNIEWDVTTDDTTEEEQEATLAGLPTEVVLYDWEFTQEMKYDMEDAPGIPADWDSVTDYLSDTYEWCVNGCEVELVED